MILLFTIGQSLLPTIANAQELNTTGFVDNFTINKTELRYGDRTTINVNFSDKSGNNMKSGDTLTLALPNELIGFNTTIPLDDEQGNNFGICKVNSTNVVCEFNEIVEKLHNIRGHFNFTVQASNVEIDQTIEVETNLGTNLEKQTVTITGPTSGGTGSGERPFFQKGGSIYPENTSEVQWILSVNPNSEQLNTDIVLYDSLQEGQLLNKDSFSMYVNDKVYLTLIDFEAQGYGSITFMDNNSFKLVFNKDKASGNKFSIGYKSTITEEGKKQEFFENDYKIEYQVVNKETSVDSNSVKVENISFGGGAEGDLPPKGTLRIIKHIAANEEKVIPNVTFKLFKELGEQVGDKYTTNGQGVIEIPNLLPGNYYVQEVSAPDYVTFDPQAKVSFEVKANAINGIKLLISNEMKTTSIRGTKSWNDNNSPDRPKTIKVDLLQNGKVIDTKEVSEATEWKYAFTDLVAYDSEGKAYKYEVKEQPVAGYQTEVNGYDITNTKVGQTKVEGTKKWKDGDGKGRPETIKVDLLQNGQVIATQEVSEATEWKYAFTDLVAYDAEGKAYKYEVKEQPVDGYQTEVNGYDITNTKVGQTKVEGTKTWKDDNAKDRPEMIKVDLLQNGKVIDTKEVSEATEWKYAFTDLVAYDAEGKAYKYEVKEQPVDGYQTEVNGYDITNTKVGQTKVEGTKKWKDGDGKGRPEMIKVDLLQNGKVIDTKEVSEATEWKYAFTDLVAYDAEGKAYKYEVKEQPVAGYQTEVNGYDITNTKVGQTKVEGKKTWKDDNAKDRPEMIKVDLLQNGQVIATQEVSAKDEWKYAFTDLVAYDAEGKAYKYEVKEQPVAGYQTEVNGYDITNTKVGQTKVEGTKTWKDDNAKDRPEMIKVDLLQNDKIIATQEVSAKDEWKYTFVDLVAYDAEGKAYKYEVKEQPVDGYQTEVNGYDITNTKVGQTKVEGTKKWKDGDGKGRPEMIKVDLLQNGKVIDTKEVSEATEWKYAFTDLVAYDAEGKAYKYEVKEQPVAGYQTEVNGYDITNTKVEGTKTWKDDNAKDRPEMIKVDLLQNDKIIATQEVSAKDEWKYTFVDLVAYDAEGKAYKYEVKEQPVAGYQTEVNGYDITNTKVGQTKVEGTKKWKDGDGKGRPETIKVDLLQNGQVIATQEVSEATEWKYAFTDLVAYDAEGKAYKYEVKEQPVDGYQTEVNGYDITNTKVGQTKVEGTKTWKDDNAKDRPEMIKVDLLQNGKVIDTKEVSEATEWKYAFTDLVAYDAEGKAYKYEVKEQPVAGYQTEVNGYDITNTKVGQTKVEGTKKWKDGDGKGRPETIKVDLLQNGQVIATQEVSEATEWKYAFTDLVAYDAEGKAYKYEVKEQPVDGYQTEVNGYDITNTKVGQTKVEGTKTWKDDNAKDRPEMIKVDLLQNGKVIDTKEVSEVTEWKYAFTDLVAYDAEGKAYKYEVKEQPVAGYQTEVNGYDITNTKVGQTKVEGTKKWKDGDGKGRPETIKVDLLQNGQVIATQEVSAKDEWKYTFVDLVAYDAEGKAYKYEVKEQPVAGYQTEVNGYDITNTKVGQTKVEGTKKWKDGDGKGRPEMIKVDLLQNGKVIDTKEVSEATEWKYAFTDLVAYDAEGKAYKYEVKEQPVDGYQTEVNGYDITNTKVGQTKVEGTKKWKDGDGKGRPEMIKVDLLQNGKVIDTKEVSEATEWKYAFTDLVAYDAEGKAYKYEVKEQPVAGYQTEVNGYDITNTKVGQTKVEGKKTWKDDNAKDRPEMIKVDLLQNDKIIATQEVSAKDEWKYTFVDLVAYDAEGKAYKYEVKEQPVAGYESKVEGYDITNTKVGQTKVEGTKTWKDDNAKDRPEMIKVDLLQNGKVIDTKEVSEATEWKYAFTDLVAYDAEGKSYKYEVTEHPVNGYQSEVNGYNITNTKIKGESVVVPKENTSQKGDVGELTTKESDQKTSLLPNTGRTIWKEFLSFAGGILLLVLGGFIFTRKKLNN
ncbi:MULTISPECIES: Cna B-type domain-containing protein [Bacillus cereus group]|nr:Cna B-type domain-containing protein [Bacillus cereus]BCC06552.1 hypothetical protein BCM0060_2815 [Bacillus cereus]